MGVFLSCKTLKFYKIKKHPYPFIPISTYFFIEILYFFVTFLCYICDKKHLKNRFMSVENQILEKIKNNKRGKIFFPNDFHLLGTDSAIRQSLNRLEKKDILVRLSNGIYLFPKKHKVLGILKPSTEEIALAIAKRDKARLIPTGSQALNKLGFTTQVPMNAVFLTDGSRRVIKIGKRNIKFKVAPPKLLSVKNETNIYIIQALRELGQENVTQDIKLKIAEILKNVNKEDLKHDIKLAPRWIAAIMQNSL